jgi:hypothetical protein
MIGPEPERWGAVIEAWAFGALSGASQTNSLNQCDLSHACALAVSSPGGTGTSAGVTVKTFFQSAAQGDLPANLPFTMMETIDYQHPATIGSEKGQVACYPAYGTMLISSDPTSVLVLYFVGQACLLDSMTTGLVFTGSYTTGSASTGTFANADGIGSMNIISPSGLPGTWTEMKASMVGQLTYGNH